MAAVATGHLPRTLFMYRAGRRERLTAGTAYPSEFFYGWTQLKANGAAVDILDEADIARLAGGPGASAWSRLARRALSMLLGRTVPGLALENVRQLLARPVRGLINGFDAVLCTTTSLGIAACALKRAGLLSCEIVILAMGLAGLRPFALLRWLLRSATIVSISASERDRLRVLLGDDARVHCVPFGVDTAFWSPGPSEGGATAYALTVGNDVHRDYETLCRAWTADLPTLKAVTSMVLPALPSNVEHIQGDWRSATLSDAEIRALYRGALFVVVPLKQTLQPSGQSVCLQAMACGKAVVITDIDGLWDREFLRHGETCLLVPPGAPGALAAAAAELVRDPGLAERLGSTARARLAGRQDVQSMAEGIASVLDSLGRARARDEAMHRP